MNTVFFGVFAGVTLFSALALIWQKNLLYAAFLLLITFIGVACLYLLLGADFLAVTQLLIYVGGVLTLFLFGILITQRREKRFLTSGLHYQKLGALVAIVLAFLLFYAVSVEYAVFPDLHPIPAATSLIGYGLLTQYLVPFELAGVLLLALLVGVLAISSPEKPA